jgi:type 1 glutamine amidotransferase
VRVLARLDPASYEGHTMGADHPIAWCHTSLGGRAFYTGGGHTPGSFSEEGFRAHLAGALRWICGLE